MISLASTTVMIAPELPRVLFSIEESAPPQFMERPFYAGAEIAARRRYHPFPAHFIPYGPDIISHMLPQLYRENNVSYNVLANSLAKATCRSPWTLCVHRPLSN